MVRYNWILSRKMKLFLHCFLAWDDPKLALVAGTRDSGSHCYCYCPLKLLVFSWVKENVIKSWSELITEMKEFQSLSELIAAKAERLDNTDRMLDSDWNCNWSFFLGIAGFAKRTFLYQILMCGSEGTGG